MMSSQPSSPSMPRRLSFGSVTLPDPRWSSGPPRGSYHETSSGPSDSEGVSSDDSASSSGESDRVRLTGRAGASSLRLPPSSPRGRRRLDQPPRPTSPIVERGTAALRAVGRKVRRISGRAANLGAADEVWRSQARRLPDANDSDSDASVPSRTRTASSPYVTSSKASSAADNAQTRAFPPATPAGPKPLVGNSLGVFSPGSRFRKACWLILRHRATDPVLLLLVLANVILIIVQAERPVGTRAEAPYFRRWEDYCLVILFAIFTLEAAARIIVSGLLLDPHTASAIAAADESAVGEPAADGSTPPSPRPSTDSAVSEQLKRDPKIVFRKAVARLRAVLALTGTASENARRRDRKAQDGGVMSDSSDDDIPLSIAPLVPNSTTTPSPPMASALFSTRRRRGAAGVQPSFIASKLASTLPVSLIAHPVPSPAQASPADGAPSVTERLRRALRTIELPFQRSLLHERQIQLLGRPYLRHSWNRVDAVAILCFWTMLGLALTEREKQDGFHLFIFRALSILRASRLLLITSGTATILHSLKRAAPLLANAFALFLAALALFSIIGVQAFSGSYRRSCYLVSPTNASDLINLGNTCGSWFDSASASVRGAVPLADLSGDAVGRVKGYTCPPPQICAVADENLVTGQTFDNVLGSALQVFVISSANGWSPIMFEMQDSDYFAAAIFFILGLVVLNFWLSQLGVAIIVSSFHDVRAETRRSAFGGRLTAVAAPALGIAPVARPSKAAILYQRSRYLWVALAVASLAAQATLTAGSSRAHLRLISHLNLSFASAFGLEMVIRLLAAVPTYRAFFQRPRNWLDLILAVVSLVIELPVIRASEAYGWLAIFPLARWYRVILVVPRMKPLLLAVFGQVGGLLNMTAFLGLNILLGAILAIQLFQDDIPQDGETIITFHSLYNALLGMFQVMTSENWTDPLNNAMAAEWPFRQGALSALFLCVWFVFSNFVMLQMFVACVSENFSVAADSAKRERQLHFYLDASSIKPRETSWLDRLNPKRMFSPKPVSSEGPKLSPSLVLPSKPAAVRDDADPSAQRRPSHFGLIGPPAEEGMLDYVWRVLRRRSAPSESIAMDNLGSPSASSTNRASAADQRAAASKQRERTALFISRHPSWDRSLFVFRQTNPIRQLCQRLVPSPVGGVRSFGRPASPAATFALKAGVCLTVLCSIVTAAVATPAYRRDRYDPDADSIAEWPWYDVVDCSLALVFTIELAIKVVADGLLLGPSPYLRSPWNALDGVVYIGLLINTITTVTSVGGLNVFTRALKAVRCLRLISISTRLRATVTSVLQGASKIVDASVLVVLYMIPYAVWGVILFRGRLFRCNNDADRADCIGEYLAMPIDGVGSGFPLPQVWANPTLDEGGMWSFDDFRQSILILFEIVSLEGWTSVMGSLMALTAKGRQPRLNASSGNALFLVFYMLFGAVIILALFVSIFLSNFSARSGAALLTTEQRHWVDLLKSIRCEQPSRKPKQRPTGFRSWCFDRAVSKSGWWNQLLGLFYVVHCATLLSQSYGNSAPGGRGDTVRDCLYLGLCVVFAGDLLVRYLGLGWQDFRANKWSMFRIVMIAGASVTTALSLGSTDFQTSVVGQLQKVFLVGLCLNLIERSSRLSQLFKTALASLPAISNLFLLWLVLFGFYGIMFLEAFGLTKHNTQENRYISFRDFATSLVMLAVFTNGEGWNGYMHDYALSWPRCTKDDNLYLRSDCGSVPAAYALFASWNILSMYLFVNLVTACVVESFSYVFYLPGKTSLSRQQLRAYKKAWAETDKNRTGFISRDQVGTLLYKLSGVLEVKPYPSELSLRNLVALASASPGASSAVEGTHACVDIGRLGNVLDRFNFEPIKHRRQRFERLFREAALTANISFAAMLELLAHHVLIDDELALPIEELVRRRERTDHVQRLIDIAKVESILLATVYRRRRRRRLTLQPATEGLPCIVLEPAPPPEPGSPAPLSMVDAEM